MQYILLIHDDETRWQQYSEAEAGQIIERYTSFSESLAKSGAMRSGERLHPSTNATTVRVRDGETVLSDGPFAETKEQLGGFYIVEAADLDEATKMAAQIPTAETGCVEVRPVWEMG